MKKEFWEEAFSTSFTAIIIAVPLVWLAYVIKISGIKSAAIIATPMLCCFYYGQITARNKWMRDMDDKIAELKKRNPL